MEIEVAVIGGARGAVVDVVEAYRTVVPEDAARRAREIFGAAKPDWITFTSSSTAKNFLAAAGREALEGVRVASIGPVTSQTLREAGVAVDVEAEVYTTDGLIAAIRRRECPPYQCVGEPSGRK